MRRFVTALTLMSLASAMPLSYYGTADAAPAPRPEAAQAITTSAPAHHLAPAKARRITLAHKVFSAHGQVGEKHAFSPSFVRGMRAAWQHTAATVNPQRTVDYGRVIAVSGNSILVRQEMPFHVAHGPKHSRHLFTDAGAAAPLEHIQITGQTLVAVPGAHGTVQHRHGGTAGLTRGATVVAVGSVDGNRMQATVVANLAANKVHNLGTNLLQHARLRQQHFRLGGARPLGRHAVPASESDQNGSFTGCWPDYVCLANQYTSLQYTPTSPGQEDQGGLTVYDDGFTSISLASVGYTLNIDDFIYNWPMVFKATAPANMYETQQQPIDVSVDPQQIQFGQYTFAFGLGVSFGATFNVTVGGYTTQTSVGAGYGVTNTTADPAPLAGQTLDVPPAACYNITGFDFKGASLAGVNLCFDLNFEGANLGTRFTPTGANPVNEVGNPIASPASGQLSSTPEPLFVVPDANNWSLKLDQFYWAPKMSLSGYIQFQAGLGAGPVSATCTCTTWNTPAVTFPGYPAPIPMIDYNTSDPLATENAIHFGDPLNPQTSSVSYSFTATPAPTVLTYTGGTNFKTGSDIGVSAHLVDNQSNPVVGATVNFALSNGQGCSAVTDALGDTSTCFIDIVGTQPGQYGLVATFNGGGGYVASNTGAAIALSATDLVMTYTGHTSDLGQGSGYFAVDIKGIDTSIYSYSTGVQSLQVAFILNGKTMCTTDETNTDFSYWVDTTTLHMGCWGFLGVPSGPGLVTGFDSGAYTVTAVLEQNDYYKAAPVTAPFDIEKLPTSLAAAGNTTAAYHSTTTLAAHLTSQYGTPYQQTVVLSVGDGAQMLSCAGSSDGDGNVSCSVGSMNLAPGNYTMTMTYAGDGVWSGSTATAPFTVTKGDSTLTYTGPAGAAFHDKNVVLSATLTQPNNGVSIVGQDIRFALGSQSCDGTTDIHGNASCLLTQITQDPGATLTVSYAGSNLYNGTSITPAFNITPLATNLAYTGSNAATYHDPLALSATLTEANGGPPIANQPVHFALGSGPDQQTCDGTTDAQGNASCAIPSLTVTPGNPTLTVSFAGNADYVASTATVPFSLAREDVHLAYTGVTVQDTLDSVTVSGTLNEHADGSGPAISGQAIVFAIGSQTCTGTSDNNGQASCSIASLEQAPGSSTVQMSYAGSDDYNGGSIGTPFTINQEETTVSYTGTQSMVANGASFTLSANLLDPANPAEGESTAGISGETVTLALGTQSCTGTTAADGSVNCTIAAVNLPDGPQTVTVTFAGDATYLKSSDSSHQVLVYSTLSNGGAFVLGDRSVAAAGPSTTLTFWGAQWASANQLSGGSASPSFKGYAVSAGGLTCGASWTGGPGNSASPPPTVPAYMAVAVTGNVTKSGNSISGTIVKVVIVKTNPGYGPSPSSAGTGEVVATICG